jgi:hypothetical protein
MVSTTKPSSAISGAPAVRGPVPKPVVAAGATDVVAVVSVPPGRTDLGEHAPLDRRPDRVAEAIAIPVGNAPGDASDDVRMVSESIDTPSEAWTTIAGSRPAETRTVRQPLPTIVSDWAPVTRTASSSRSRPGGRLSHLFPLSWSTAIWIVSSARVRLGSHAGVARAVVALAEIGRPERPAVDRPGWESDHGEPAEVVEDPFGGASISSSTEASAVRAANTQ